MVVLGISAFYHDSAAALVRDGRIVAAAQEERFSRKKNDSAFPAGAIAYCLRQAGLTLGDVDYIGFYDKPLLTFNRLLETYLTFAPRGFTSFVRAIPVWVKEKLFLKQTIMDGLNALGQGNVDEEKVLFDFHHYSHAASAFYPSPFAEAAILVMDGVGEWATTSFGTGRGSRVELTREVRFPHSLGLLYSAFTYHLGFKVNDGEYKVMGLAPYGQPRFVDAILDNLLTLRDDGSFYLNQDYFDYCTGLTMTNGRFDKLFGGPPRRPEQPLEQRHMDMARSVQAVMEEALLRIARHLHRETGQKHLCMAGGVALNCVANGRLLREGPFEQIWVQPAAGDAGGALGVALHVSHTLGGVVRFPAGSGDDGMGGGLLGPEYSRQDIHRVLDAFSANYEELEEEALLGRVVEALQAGQVVGWFQGRMEFGPRALGNRSILGDARSAQMQSLLNLKIKYREGFRPFAPAVLAEDAGLWFDLDRPSPYMLLVVPVLEQVRRAQTAEEESLTGLAKLKVVRSQIPAVTHVDHSARAQTVEEHTNPRFHALLAAFKAATGVGLLVNTSFNISNEPIVCSPEDAYRGFMGTEMDMLVMGNTLLLKSEQ